MRGGGGGAVRPAQGPASVCSLWPGHFRLSQPAAACLLAAISAPRPGQLRLSPPKTFVCVNLLHRIVGSAGPFRTTDHPSPRPAGGGAGPRTRSCFYFYTQTPCFQPPEPDLELESGGFYSGSHFRRRCGGAGCWYTEPSRPPPSQPRLLLPLPPKST